MRFTFGTPHICTYCGRPADSIDHTIPYSWFRNTGSSHRREESVGFMTYACRECNNILGSRIFPTFQDRVKFVNERLRKKYRPLMSVMWDSEDLSTVSGRLKQYIEQQQRLNTEQRMRVSWRDSDDFLMILQDTCDRLYYDKSITDEHKRFLIDDDYIPSVTEFELSQRVF